MISYSIKINTILLVTYSVTWFQGHSKLSLTTVIAAQKIFISNRKAKELTLNQKLIIVAITKCIFLYYKCVRFYCQGNRNQSKLFSCLFINGAIQGHSFQSSLCKLPVISILNNFQLLHSKGRLYSCLSYLGWNKSIF